MGLGALNLHFKDGTDIPLEEVLREETPKDATGMHICTSAVFVDDNARMLFGWNVKHAPEELWCTPGGGTEEDDADVEAALRREIREECGLTNIEIVAFLGSCPGKHEHVTMRVFHCRVLSGVPSATAPDEIASWHWMSARELEATGTPFINPHILAMVHERGLLR